MDVALFSTKPTKIGVEPGPCVLATHEQPQALHLDLKRCCRQIIGMRLQQGMPYKDIAQDLGKTEGALRVQMFRCVRAARDILNGIDPESCLGVGEGGPDGPS